MPGQHHRKDGPLRTNAAIERAQEQLTTHRRWERKRIGRLQWIRVCHYCGESWPCYSLRYAREVSDARR